MKFLKICLILIMSSQVSMFAQTLSTDYNKISKEEADLAYYAPDKSAEAVVLFDIGKSYFLDYDNNFKVVLERSTRIKIFSESGLKWAEVEIPFYHEGQIYEDVYDIEGTTYNNENGIFKATYFNVATSHNEKINEFWTVKKFALPDVKPGSIIQYRYKLSSQYKMNLRNWNFQSRIPTIYSEYQVSMIPFYEYVWLLQGANKFDSQTSNKATGIERTFGPVTYQDQVYKYIMKNIPAFNDEEFITSVDDYIMKIDFQLARVNSLDGARTTVISTWAELVKALLKDEDVTKFSKKSEKLLPKILNPDSLLNKSQKEKFDLILNTVKANFNWNKSNAKYASKSPNDLLKDKFGNSADLNLLTIGLLNAAGIEAYPLMMSTRENGKIKVDYPYLKFFNYLLISATVDGKNILSDATEVLCPNERIPSRCLNDKGLLIKPGDAQWISLQTDVPSEIQTVIVTDSIGNTAHSKSLISAFGYDALKFRVKYGEDFKKIEDRVDEDVYKVDESSIEVKNQIIKDKPYILKYNTVYKTENVNNKIYLSPFLDEPINENPLKQSSRTYPLDMTYPVKRSFNAVITIPVGYKVDFIPENYKILNDLFELNYNVKNEGQTISISFNYTFKKSVYPASEYLNIKYYFKDIVRKANEKVVLIHI
jgi:transglutaminase-like putative cysteine protease